MDERYTPEILESTEVTVDIGKNRSVKVELWDTAGEEERGNGRRKFIYPATNLFFICYSIASVDENLTRQRVDFFLQEIKGII